MIQLYVPSVLIGRFMCNSSSAIYLVFSTPSPLPPCRPAYPCLAVSFVLKRDIGFYMIQLYVPSVLIGRFMCYSSDAIYLDFSKRGQPIFFEYFFPESGAPFLFVAYLLTKIFLVRIGLPVSCNLLKRFNLEMTLNVGQMKVKQTQETNI